MSRLRLAYIALLAASIALRLAFAYPHANASDQLQIANRSGNSTAAQAELSTQDPELAPLITGRSVAAPTPQASDGIAVAERRLHDGVGAAGFVRR
ncbi:MAG: hypothetical protein QOH65_341 [Methylobacteriaceae bacterium]|jgi:hypothetical protein|nr:hypothetical protein [Methylobacteriaceae bacterium]